MVRHPILNYFIMGFFDTIYGSSLFSSGLNMLSNYIGAQQQYGFQSKLANQQFGYQQQLQQQQNDYNTQMFNAANDYNSASNQVARFQAAGLNPAMMMSGGKAATATPMQSASPSFSMPNGDFQNRVDFGGIINETLKTRAIVDETKAKIDLYKSQEELNKETATSFHIDNEWKPLFKKAEYSEIVTRIDKANADIEVAKATVRDLFSQMSWRSFQKWYNQKLYDLEERKTTATENYYDASGSAAIMQGEAAKTNAAANWYNAQTQRSIGDATVKGINLDNKLKEGTLQDKITEAMYTAKTGEVDYNFKVRTLGTRIEQVHGQLRFLNGQIEAITLDNKFNNETYGKRVYKATIDNISATVGVGTQIIGAAGQIMSGVGMFNLGGSAAAGNGLPTIPMSQIGGPSIRGIMQPY